MTADISARAPAGSGGGGYEYEYDKEFYDKTNSALWSYLFLICGCVSVAVIVWRVTDVAVKSIRTIACLNTDRQKFFANVSPNAAMVKRHILYAPVLSKRHNREIQLSSAINVGTLPTRFQLSFLSAYFITNVIFCIINVPFTGDWTEATTELRNRSGILATINMVPLFLLAGRNNPLIPLLGISFDTYNLIHRWFGRIVILEAVLHTVAHLAKGGWIAAFPSIWVVPFLLWGFIATCAFVALGIQAWSPIRHAWYETFKILHIALAALAVIGLGLHLGLKGIDYIRFVYAVAASWIIDRGLRMLRLFYHNIGGRKTKTVVEAMPGEACRVTITLARKWSFRPGQHAYLYMPRLSLFQSHPFSVAWIEGSSHDGADMLAHETGAASQERISFVVKARTGFTNTLYQKALAAPGGKMTTTCFVEGPYGVNHPLQSYGTVVLFAGGVGITHMVPYVKQLVAGYSDGTVATRKILLVWTIQTPEHLEWIRPWMTQILGMEGRRQVLRVLLFVSQPRSSKEIHSPSSTVQMFPGRPNVETLLAMEQEQQTGAMAVSVCGPGGLSDEVRGAVRKRQDRSSIDFIEEAFSW